MRAHSWEPSYTITASMARGLMEIEAARVAVEAAPLPPSAQAELSRIARVRSTHYSTMIEGNGFKPNVVFTCGATVKGDTVTIYYGACDETVCAASVSASEILDSLEPPAVCTRC